MGIYSAISQRNWRVSERKGTLREVIFEVHANEPITFGRYLDAFAFTQTAEEPKIRVFHWVTVFCDRAITYIEHFVFVSVVVSHARDGNIVSDCCVGQNAVLPSVNKQQNRLLHRRQMKPHIAQGL